MIVMESVEEQLYLMSDGICDGPGADDYYDCAGNCLSDVDGDLVCDENEIVGLPRYYSV